MRLYERLLLLLPRRTTLRFFFCCLFLFPGALAAQQVTKNAFIGAKLDGGLLTIYKGDPANKELLTFIDKSYLSLKIDGLYYSNNPYGGQVGPSGALQPIDVYLSQGQTQTIRDTLRTVWKEQAFDIVQDVYPVLFSNSGVIVLSIKIVNHSSIPMSAQAQFLLDNMNSNTTGGPDSANDNPYLIHRYGYIRNWQDCPPSPIPSFYLAFEHPPTDSFLGTVGIGYVNDSFPPRPLGLMPLSLLEFGDWPSQVYYTWGPPNAADRKEFTDEAALLMGSPMGANPYMPGVTDSVTEIMRTAYGVPEWCYDHGNMFGFALYPHHLYWDPNSQTYTPNPFQVETFLFNVLPGATSHTTIRQTVGDPIRITSPQPTGLSKDTTEMQSVSAIAAGGFGDFRWTDSAIVLPTGCAASFPVDIKFDVKAGAVDTPIFFEPWECSIDVECPNPDTVAPRFQNSFAGCDSIMRDTVTVNDNYPFDLGIDSISYASPDLAPSQYSVLFSPTPAFACIKTPVKIFVHQVDTFQGGHIIFTFKDCANNVSHDTICFTVHSPIPDRTAPKFWFPASTDCHNQCTSVIVTDTDRSDTSIDRGIHFISVVSGSTFNMTASGVPPGGKYFTNIPADTIQLCVTDSMQDGKIVLLVEDSTGNYSVDSITYCTTADTHAPFDSASAFDPTGSQWHIHVTEIRPMGPRHRFRVDRTGKQRNDCSIAAAQSDRLQPDV